MVDTVSDVVAFLCAHGAEAEEVVFGEDDIGLLTPEERAAIELASVHALDTFEAILVRTRDVFVRQMAGHPCAKHLQKGWNKSSTLRKRREFILQPVPARAHCGVAIHTWGEARIYVHAWLGTRPEHWDVAERAIEQAQLRFEPWNTGGGVRPQPWRNENGCHFVTFGPPAAGDAIDPFAERVGTALASLAAPVATALMSEPGSSSVAVSR